MAETTGFERSRGYEPPPLELPPAFRLPFRPVAAGRWFLFRLLGGWHALWIAVAVAVFHFATPDVGRFVSWSWSGLALIYLRNVALMLVVVGGLHLRLHTTRSQGLDYKFDPRPLAASRRTFTFNRQTTDNMFWSLVSGCAIAALWEAALFWLYANDRIPSVSWNDGSIYIVLLTVALFFVEGAHFYLNHRLLHWGPLYRFAHSLHHRNVNTGPWSGISMHPVEHLVYFSTPVVFLVLPGHPFAVTFLMVYLLVSPSPSHSGYAEMVLPGGATMPTGDFFHHLHHRYFDCNYGVLLLPIDKWVGSFHDGSEESHARLLARRSAG